MAVLRMAAEIDVSDVLSSLRVPTLVIHCKDDTLITAECGRFIARTIPGAGLVELPGQDHLLFVHEQIGDCIEEFLTGSVSARKEEYRRPIDIGSAVWVGAGALVLPGVSIGSRSVIGAGSVVTRNIPEGVFAAGNPCRVVRDISENDHVEDAPSGGPNRPRLLVAHKCEVPTGSRNVRVRRRGGRHLLG
jgi:hypothetical protein